MWKLFLARLSAYLCPGIDGEEPPPDDGEDTPPPDDGEPPAPRVSRAAKEITTLRARSQKAEEDLARVQQELAAARRGPAPPTQDQLLWQEEEDRLKSPDITDWQKYAIQATRNARRAEAMSSNAVMRAEDLADRTRFEAIAAKKPKLYETYKDRVETMLTDLRSKGSNPPREKLLAILVGEDLLNGKLKPAETKPRNPGGATRVAARSDVSSARGRMSEEEAREKRLENVRI